MIELAIKGDRIRRFPDGKEGVVEEMHYRLDRFSSVGVSPTYADVEFDDHTLGRLAFTQFTIIKDLKGNGNGECT